MLFTKCPPSHDHLIGPRVSSCRVASHEPMTSSSKGLTFRSAPSFRSYRSVFRPLLGSYRTCPSSVLEFLIQDMFPFTDAYTRWWDFHMDSPFQEPGSIQAACSTSTCTVWNSQRHPRLVSLSCDLSCSRAARLCLLQTTLG